MGWIRVFAPASVANLGPGFDILGIAVKGLGDIVEARRIDSGVIITSIESKAELSNDPAKNTAGIAASEVLKLLNEKEGVELKLKKGLPIGSGLGSSAASAAAAAYATNYLFGNRLKKEELVLPATKAEQFVSGFHADNTAPSLLGGAVLIRSYDPLDVIKIGSINNLRIVLVIPDIVIMTREAREILPKKIPMNSFISNMANSCLITAAFSRNDYSLLSRGINDIVVEPVRKKLIRGFDHVKKSALDAGADGMSISGSGPAVFAITDDEEKAERVGDAMAETFKKFGVESTSIVSKIDDEGARLLK